MNIHEYQAKDLFRKFNITTSKGEVFENAEEAENYLNFIENFLKIPIDLVGVGPGRHQYFSRQN